MGKNIRDIHIYFISNYEVLAKITIMLYFIRS